MPDVLCIGGANRDATYRLPAPAVLGTSNPAEATLSFGGVARNVAETLGRIGVPASLLAAVGADSTGWELIDHLAASGVDSGLVQVINGLATSHYVAVLDPEGELVIGVNDMAITDRIAPADIESAGLDSFAWVFAECNLAKPALGAVIEARRAGGRFRLAIDAISVPKVTRLPGDLTGIDVLFANADEANALLGTACAPDRDGTVALARRIVAEGAESAVVTNGASGCVAHSADGTWVVGAVPARVVDVTGAGDARIAGTIAALIAGTPLHLAAREGSLLAAIAAESPATIEPRLSPAFLASTRRRLDAVTVEGPLP